MKSISCIIILMSLIGNCPSAKAFCTSNKNHFCSENMTGKISVEEAKQMLLDFNVFISNYHKSLKKNFSYSGLQLNLIEGKCSKRTLLHNSKPSFLSILERTSKVRNKDCLNNFVLNRNSTLKTKNI